MEPRPLTVSTPGLKNTPTHAGVFICEALKLVFIYLFFIFKTKRNKTANHLMMSSVPVVAAYSGVGQAGVTRPVDVVGVCVELCRAAPAASVSDVTAQRHHDAFQ